MFLGKADKKMINMMDLYIKLLSGHRDSGESAD